MSEIRELIEKNIELSTEFSRYLFEHPEIEERLSVDAEVVLLPEDDEELKRFNLQTGAQIEAKGEKVAYVTIKKMRPRVLSRIEELELSAIPA